MEGAAGEERSVVETKGGTEMRADRSRGRVEKVQRAMAVGLPVARLSLEFIEIHGGCERGRLKRRNMQRGYEREIHPVTSDVSMILAVGVSSDFLESGTGESLLEA